jgi:hypothetical protein
MRIVVKYCIQVKMFINNLEKHFKNLFLKTEYLVIMI